MKLRLMVIGALAAGASVVLAGQADKSKLTNPAALTEQAPETYKANFATSQGAFVITVNRKWAPIGSDRFYNLVRGRFFDGVEFFRVYPGFVVQFGISGYPEVSSAWKNTQIPDDPVKGTNSAGSITFATAGPGTRTTQVFINLRDNHVTHDVEPFVPFGHITRGVHVALALNTEYGDNAGGGIRGGKQDPLFEGGNAFIDATYPKLDRIVSVTVK